jgi:hypothetical protein
MRAVVLLSALAGCSLYFDTPHDMDKDGPYPDSGPFPDIGDPPWGGRQARCEDGDLYVVDTGDSFADTPGHGAGLRIGSCEGGCRSAAITCSDSATSPNCANASDLCRGEAFVQRCSLEGTSCTGNQTAECPRATTCGYSVPGDACVCGSDGRFDCSPRTPAATVQQQLVGKWRGTVTPPDFAQPYQISLWFYPDGTYWAENAAPSSSAFYYGGDGPHELRKLEVLSSSATEGSWADIAIYFGGVGANTGAVSGLTVTATKLRFTYYASWFGCGQPFTFDLTRE